MTTVVNSDIIKCTICAKKNKRLEAVKYCIECQSYCCRDCVDTHETFPVLMGHTLLDSKADLGSSEVSKETNNLPTAPTVRYRKHKSKVVDMYCGNHDTVGCSTCMTMGHRSCVQLHLIPDEIDSLYRVADQKQTKKDLKASKTMITELVSTKADTLIRLKQWKNRTKESIKHFKNKFEKDMETFIAEHEEDAIKQLQLIYTGKKENLLAAKADLESQESNVNEVNDELTEAEGSRAQEFVWMKFAQAKMLALDSMDSSLFEGKDIEIAFDLHPNIRTYFEQVKNFGNIYVNEVEAKPIRNTTYTVEMQYDINLKLPEDDSRYCFEGSCVTPDGFLLVTDFFNHKLKCVDIRSSSLVDHCTVHSFPAGVCCVEDKQVAVACVGSRTIRFVKLGKEMTSTKQFNVDHSCFGIASNGEKLFVTDYEHSVYVYDKSGTLLKRVTKDTFGNSLFRSPRHIALSDKGNRLYICNSDRSKGVTILDTEGKYLSFIKHPEMPMSYGVYEDGSNNIFVCGYKTDNIMQFNLNGKLREVILSASDALNAPQSVCFYSSTNKLFETENENGKVKVFVLK